MFDPLIVLLRHRFRMLVPNLRGHERSGDLDGPCNVQALASDLDVVLAEAGFDRCAVMGYSHGGAVAQQILACTYACNVSTLRERVTTAWLGRSDSNRGSRGCMFPAQQLKSEQSPAARSRRADASYREISITWADYGFLSLNLTCPARQSGLCARGLSARRSDANCLRGQNSAASLKYVRPFKGIFCDDISEFESYMASQPVRLQRVRYEGRLKTARYRVVSQI
jgi:alpha/beta hydrolase family protein